MTTTELVGELNVREKIRNIDRMLADNGRKHQEIRCAPWLAVISGMTAGAALFVAGAAFMGVLQ